MHMTGEVGQKRLCVPLIDTQLSEMFLFWCHCNPETFYGLSLA